MFAAKTYRDSNSFNKQTFNELSSVIEYAATAIDNLRSSDEIIRMNSRLSALNQQMLQSSKFATIGELAGAFAWEIDTPLQIIKANLQLLHSGVGDSQRRLQIITEQVGKITEVNKRLSNLALSPPSELSPSPFKLCSLIDEVLLFSGSHLQRDDIKVEKVYENTNIQILGFKHQIELVLLNLLLYARNTMPEGGLITIGVFNFNKNKVLVSIADNGNGINENEIEHLFEPTVQSSKNFGFNSGLFFIKNIIQQHKANFSVVSEVGKGTTYKIIFQLYANKSSKMK